jgi:hypothetical protein
MEPPKANPLTSTMDILLRNVVKEFEKNYKVRPYCVLACQDFADEHWQVRHPATNNMHFVIDKDLEVHEFHYGS